MRQLGISTGKRRDSHVRTGDVTWPQLAKKLLDHKRVSETVAAYKDLPVEDKGRLKALRGFVVGGKYSGQKRLKEELMYRSVITLDIDHCTDPQRVIDSYDGYEFAMHSTLSHRDDAPRLRIVFPVVRDLTPFEYEAVARNLGDQHGMNDFDDTTFQVSRIMYWPIACSDADPIAYQGKGDWINPDDWDPAQDFMDWPRSDRVGGLTPPGKQAGNPFDRPGIIGAFNRTYDIHAAIAKFIPDTFEQTEFDNRYRPVGSTGEAGAVVYDDDSQLYVHHEHPAELSNKLSNAFDMVRRVRFGDDEDSDEPMMQRASFKAMVHLLADDSTVQAEIERPAIDDELPVDEEADPTRPRLPDVDEYAATIVQSGVQTTVECDAFLNSIAAYDAHERDMLLKVLQDMYPIKPGIQTLRDRVKQIRLATGGVIVDEELADIERELVDEVLAEHFEGGAHLRRVGRKFWIYQGGVWMLTDDEVIEGKLQKTLVRLREERPQDVTQLVAAIGDSKTTSLVGSLVRMLRARLAEASATGKDPLQLLRRITEPVVNTLSGELHFDRDGSFELRPHDPENFYTLQTACEYDQHATCPEWDRFMEMAFSECIDPEDMIRHVEELGGYIVNMSRWLKSWVLFHGPTDTGKSSTLDVFKELLGDACLAMELGRFKMGSSSFADSMLLGKLLLADDDFDKSASLPDGFIKKISEEKRVTSDIKFGDAVTFSARCLPLVCANHWPVTRDVSDAFRERAMVFEFTHRIRGAEQDDHRRDLMLLELPGILNRFVAGLQRLRKRGDWKTPIDAAISHESWVGQSNQAHMYIGDRMEQVEGERAKRPLVWRDYQNWVRDQGGFKLGQREFFERMHELLGEPSPHEGTPSYRGWRLLPPDGITDEEL